MGLDRPPVVPDSRSSLNMTDSPALTKFLDDLIYQKHGADISPDVHAQLRDELVPRLEKWLILKSMEAIAQKSPADLKAFQNMVLAEVDNSKIITFMAEKIPDTDAFITHALLDFWTTYLHPETAQL